jgi:hypothetical protein
MGAGVLRLRRPVNQVALGAVQRAPSLVHNATVGDPLRSAS